MTTKDTTLFEEKVTAKEKELGVDLVSFFNKTYWDECKSPNEIGIMIGMPTGTITTWMRRLGIKMRTKSESMKLFLQKNSDAHQHIDSPLKNPEIQRLGNIKASNNRRGKTYEEIYGPEKAKQLKQLYSDQRKGELNPIFGTKRPQHVCDALSKAHKGKKQDPEYRIRRLKAAFAKARMAPNSLETRIINIINEYDLPFKFVGDGSMIIHGFSPDFISVDGSMRIIEVFGDYWHSESNPNLTYTRTEEGRKKVFADLGYDMLVLWESHINNNTDEALNSEIELFLAHGNA